MESLSRGTREQCQAGTVLRDAHILFKSVHCNNTQLQRGQTVRETLEWTANYGRRDRLRKSGAREE